MWLMVVEVGLEEGWIGCRGCGAKMKQSTVVLIELSIVIRFYFFPMYMINVFVIRKRECVTIMSLVVTVDMYLNI